jgi:tetratricopeptide (TPR) repeat protein
MGDDLLDNARMLVQQDDGEEALKVAAEAIELFNKAGNKEGSNAALRATIMAVFANDGSAVALKTATEELEKAKGKDKLLEAAMLHAMAEVYIGISEGTKALASLTECVEICSSTGAKTALTEALLTQAEAYALMDKYKSVLAVAMEAVEHAVKTGDEKSQGAAWVIVMKARVKMGQYENAMKAGEGAMVIFLRLKSPAGKVSTFTSIAAAHLANFQYKKALKAASLAIETSRELKAAQWEATALDLAVDALIKSESFDEAVRQGKQGLVYIGKYKKKRITAKATTTVIRAYVARGSWREAMPVAKQALETFREIGDRQEEANMLLEIAKLNSSMGELDAAATAAEQSIPIFKLVGDEVGVKAATEMFGAQEDAKAVKEQEGERKAALKDKLKAFEKALDARNSADLKAALEALYADDSCTTEDVEKIMEPIIAGDPDGVYEFMKENVEELDEDKPLTGHGPQHKGERVFDKWKKFDRRFLYYMFRVNMMGYGPGFRLLKTVYRMGDHDPDPRKYPWGIATLTYKDDMDDWEVTTGYHPGLLDCALQTGSSRNPEFDYFQDELMRYDTADDKYPHNKRTFGLYGIS